MSFISYVELPLTIEVNVLKCLKKHQEFNERNNLSHENHGYYICSGTPQNQQQPTHFNICQSIFSDISLVGGCDLYGSQDQCFDPQATRSQRRYINANPFTISMHEEKD